MIQFQDPTVYFLKTETKKPINLYYECIISKIQTLGNSTGQMAWVFQQVKEMRKKKTLVLSLIILLEYT